MIGGSFSAFIVGSIGCGSFCSLVIATLSSSSSVTKWGDLRTEYLEDEAVNVWEAVHEVVTDDDEAQ